MAVAQVVNTGTQANDATGDLLRDAFTKINTNFAALFAGNFPAAQLTVGPPVSGNALSVVALSGQNAISTTIGGVNFATPSSGNTLTVGGFSGSTAIVANAASATDLALFANGNVNLGASSLSTITLNGAITASGANGGTVLKLNAAAGTTAAIFDSTNAAGPDIRWSNSGTTFGFMGSWLDLIGSGNNSDLLIRSNNAFGLAAGGGTVRFQVASTGGVSVNAPTSGDALTITNVAGANALTLAGNSAGTAVLRLNTQATTGAQTATFAASNKPGSGTTGPDKWIPISLDGTTHYVPAFL